MAQNITLLGASYSDVPAVKLPKTGGGNATFTDVTDTTAVASDVATGKYFYLSDGSRVQGTSSGGGGGSVTQDQDGFIILPPDGGGSPSVSGLEYEEGTWTPSEDLQSTWITFSNAHTVAPFYYMIMDVTATYNSTSNSNGGIVYYNWGQAFGEPLHTSSTGVRYGIARKFLPSGSSSTSNISYPHTNNTDNSVNYPRYWAKETGINADSYADGYYWRTGRTYKWIAVWTPTT